MRRRLFRLIAAQISLHACMTGFRMAAPLMSLREGHSPAAVGLLLALFALSQVFLSLPAGRFADKHGLKRPLLIAVIIATAGALLAVAFPVFEVLCFTALTCGASTGLALIALQRHVGQLAHGPTELKQVFSWMAIGPSVSNFVGPFSAGLLIDASGFRAAYLLLAVLPAIAWLLVRHAQELEPVVQDPLTPRGRSWHLLRDAGFRRLMLINWMLSSCWDVHTFLVPVIGNERGLS
ncbi:MAG: MFS transporter, partial [Hydrogenophaga sp.]